VRRRGFLPGARRLKAATKRDGRLKAGKPPMHMPIISHIAHS